MAGRPLLERWRLHLRRGCDAGSASMASYVLAAAVFVMTSTYLVHFVIEPPGGSGTATDDQILTSRAETLLDIILGSPGSPVTWDASPAAIDQVRRLGLLDVGSTLRIDADKFDALARGRTLTTSSANGGVDYDEAKAALGLTEHEFRLRAYPVKTEVAADDPYGTNGYEDYRVAYVGKWSGSAWSAEATAEANALDALDVGFVKELRDAVPTKGDLFKDQSGYIREHLLPNIGSTVEQTVLSNGAGTKFDFWRVEPAAYQGLVPGTPAATLSRALALSSDGATLGYTKNREIRAIVGEINMTGQTSASLSWKEWVDTDRGNLTYDCQDYGFVEVSHDGGANWIRLTDNALERSQDCSPAAVHGPAMTPREIADLTLTCTACDGKPSVLVAFHWFADNDNNAGYGWVVDDVVVEFGVTPVVQTTFEGPSYDMVIIGSGIDHQAFTPEEVKTALRDFVLHQGGRLFVTGQSSNVQWLDRLFDASSATASGGVTIPDVAHPILTLPSKLDVGAYTRAKTWSFTGSDDAGLFLGVVTESASDKHVMSISRSEAWTGTDEGAVILSSYLAHAMSAEEARRYFANGIVYGKFRHLYLEFGGEIPKGEPVASATRIATLNKHRTGAANHTDIAFVLHVWSGRTVPAPGPEVAQGVAPGAPIDLVADAGTSSVTLTWKPPTSFGTSSPTFYRVYNASSNTVITTVTHTGASSYSYTDTGLLNGRTYYYTVTLLNDREGGPSNNASTTPVGLPGAPAAPTVTPLTGQLKIDWSPPSDTGGGAIFGYLISVNSSPPGSGYVTLVEVGNVTTYTHSVSDTAPRSYVVRALNARGWSVDSAASPAVSAIDPPVPVGAPTLVVTNGTGKIHLTWTPPSWLGQTPSAFKIYRADGAGGPFTLLATLSPANATFDDVGIAAGVSKWYRVSAVTDESGEGTLSEIKTGKAWSVPQAPTGLVVDIVPLTTTRTLSWTAPSSDLPITHYIVHRGNSPGNYDYTSPPIVGTSTVDDPLTSGPRYYVVTAVSAAGTSAYSNEDS